MGRWTEQAQWVGPTPNVSGPMDEQRGMVLHVMQGSLAGSIAWGKNPASQVSFHFGTSKAGACQQLVDTDVTAWTQGAGNGSWVSVENEDFSGNPLNAAQVENCAQLYARGVREYGWPYLLANSPSGRGLGYHAMGGAAWGNHPDCPGQPIIDQRGLILARAEQINGGSDAVNERDLQILEGRMESFTKMLPEVTFPPGFDETAWNVKAIVEIQDGVKALQVEVSEIKALLAAGGGGGTGGPTLAQITAAVRAELDATRLTAG